MSASYYTPSFFCASISLDILKIIRFFGFSRKPCAATKRISTACIMLTNSYGMDVARLSTTAEVLIYARTKAAKGIKKGFFPCN